MRKGFLLLTVTVLAALLAWWLVPSLVSSQVGHAGSEALGVPFSVGDMTVNPFSGTASLSDVQVHSMDPFEEPYVLEVDRIEARFEPSSLLGSHIVVNEVVISGARITVEQKGATLNLNAVSERLMEYAASADTTQAPRVFIQEIRFESGAGTLITDLGTKEFEIGNVVLTNLGSESSGTPIVRLANAIMGPILAETIESAGLPALGGSRLSRLRELIGR